MDSTVKSVAANGDISWEMVIGDVSIDEAADASLASDTLKAFAGLKGLSGSATTSDRGFGKGVHVDIPDGIPPQTRQMIEQWREGLSRIAVHLPKQAIGPGAKWQVSTPIKPQGVNIDQTTTCELFSIEGNRLRTTSAIVQIATNQPISNPAMPSLKAELIKMTGSASGNVTYDLGRIMPSEATIDHHSEVSMTVDTGGQDQDIEIKTDLHLQMGNRISP